MRLDKFYSYTEKKINKKDKENKTKQNKQTTLYNNHIGNPQINSSGTAYLLMC